MLSYISFLVLMFLNVNEFYYFTKTAYDIVVSF